MHLSPLLLPEHFHHPQRNPVPSISSHFPFLPYHQPLATLIDFLSLWNFLFWTFRISGIIQGVVFVSGFFHLTVKTFSCIMKKASQIWYIERRWGGLRDSMKDGRWNKRERDAIRRNSDLANIAYLLYKPGSVVSYWVIKQKSF